MNIRRFSLVFFGLLAALFLTSVLALSRAPVTFVFENQTKFALRVQVYAEGYGSNMVEAYWPGKKEVWIVESGQTLVQKLSYLNNAKLCYQAVASGNPNIGWGGWDDLPAHAHHIFCVPNHQISKRTIVFTDKLPYMGRRLWDQECDSARGDEC